MLTNQYVVLRHGQSKANVAKIIVSDVETGRLAKWGLTDVGKLQVAGSIQIAKNTGLLDTTSIIYSSPFSRCVESARIARNILGPSNQEYVDFRLRERWFGSLERTHHDHYQQVWDLDKYDPHHTAFGVESAYAVQQRTMLFIRGLEQKHQHKTILLVSHGDVLQVMETGLLQLSAAHHRDLAYLNVAEIRKLVLKSTVEGELS